MKYGLKEVESDINHINWVEVYASSIHKIIPLDFLEGSLKEGLRKRLQTKSDLPIYPLGYYEILNGRILGNGVVSDSKKTLLYSKKLTFDKATESRVKVFRCGQFIDERSIEVSDDLLIRKVPYTVVNVMMPGMYIYGHWLIDILPKLYMVITKLGLGNFKILMPENIPSIGLELMKMLELSDDHIIYFNPDKEIIECSKVVLPMKCRILDGSWLSPFVGTMYEEIAANNYQMLGETKFADRIYLSRRNLKNQFRKLINRDEVSDLIKSYGFIEVFPEDYSLIEQLEMYSKAKIMIGEFGSALHNSLFAGKELKVISLQSNHIPLLVQWGVCNIKGQSCSLIFGEATEIRKSINSDFRIELQDLNSILDVYCNKD